jgi:hypothetical protein
MASLDLQSGVGSLRGSAAESSGARDIDTGRGEELDEGALYEAWADTARELLKRYGVNPSDATWGRTWDTWVDVIGTLRPEDYRGSLFVLSMHATGWAGLVARHFALALHTRSFVVFCLFLIAYGMYHDYNVAKYLNDPVLSWLLGLRCVVDDLKSATKDKSTT